MSAGITSIASLFSDALVAKVFAEILKRRSARLNEIENLVGSPKAEVEQALANLQQAELIKELPSTISDFNTYYLTADGFGLPRKLKLNSMSELIPS